MTATYENPVQVTRFALTPVERAAVPLAEVAAALMRATGIMEGRREVIVDDLICVGVQLVTVAGDDNADEFTDGEVLVLDHTRRPQPTRVALVLDPVFWASVAADWLTDWREDDEPADIEQALAAEIGRTD